MRRPITLLLAAAALAAQPESRTAVSGGGFFPVAIHLKNKDVLAVLRGGAPHVGVKGRLDLIRSRDGGKTWSKPWVAVDADQDDRNPAMGQLRDGSILLGYVILSGFDKETGLKLSRNRNERSFEGVYLTRSRDGGKTWSKSWLDPAIHKFYWGQGAVSPYGKIIQLKDGTVLMSVYFEFHDGRGNESYVFRSRDNGQTWGEPALIGKHYNETAIQLLPDGKLLAALRSEKGGNLAVSESADGGRTWSEPKRVTADSEHPADLIVLRDGRVLMTYGQRNAPRGAHAVLSRDGGRTWDMAGKAVLANGAPNGDCGYPSSVEVGKGQVMTIYYQVDDLKDPLATSKANVVLWKP